jgi:hypothetical protein
MDAPCRGPHASLSATGGTDGTRVPIRLLDVIEGDDLERSTSRGVDHIRRDTRFGERLDDRARREGTAHML